MHSRQLPAKAGNCGYARPFLAIKKNKKHKMEEVNNQEEELQEVEILDESENEIVEFRYAITSYGADYPVDSIVSRVRKETIFIPPFQRKYVWKLPQASKFIESLILGLPVPGVFLSKERESAKHIIVDGQQRIMTLYKFYEGIFDGKEFALKGVQEDLIGKTYKTLSTDDQTRLDDCILHATIIKQDAPTDDDSSIYMIFERLNTGGTPLRPQEIRACIYYGMFNEYLISSTENESWRKVFGKPNTRMKEEELILRFLALYFGHQNYQKPLKTFLNSFMSKNRDFGQISEEQMSNVFHPTIDFIADTLGKNAFRPGRVLNAAAFDAIMIGTALYLKNNTTGIDQELYINAYNELLEDEDFKTSIVGGTSDESTVAKRINLAIEKFAQLS